MSELNIAGETKAVILCGFGYVERIGEDHLGLERLWNVGTGDRQDRVQTGERDEIWCWVPWTICCYATEVKYELDYSYQIIYEK